MKELEPWRGPEHAERKKGKGKGGKGAPQEIADLDHNTPNGDRICWNFNLKNKSCKYAKAAAKPKRGVHCCVVCSKDHPYHTCDEKSCNECGSSLGSQAVDRGRL